MIKNIIILLGLPGSGKGTQGEFISKELAIPHISTGDILRKMVNEGCKDSELLATYMKEGKLIPDNLVNKLVKNFILSDTCKHGCVLDGYPRNLRQAEYFIENIDANISTIFFDVSDDIATKRILGRVACASCNKVYNKYFDKPKKQDVCDKCGSKEFISRSDDDKDTILLRLEEYKNNTLPMVEYYKKHGKFFTVPAGESIKKVTEEVASIIKKI
ncbi:MAG: adenylate kinase [Rickettsiaceae bacterium]|nr:adenylate kinase [Rickettsiaceae bacterium]